jgi:hypothetical protein
MRRPTPAELAEIIPEDVQGSTPVSGMGGVGSAASWRDDGTLSLPVVDSLPPNMGGDATAGQSQRPRTAMRSCAAMSCAHNIASLHCGLEEIEVDERGGCARYEPAAAEGDDQRRYDEEEIDVGDMPAMQTGAAIHNPNELRSWVSAKVTPWDPQGSAQ